VHKTVKMIATEEPAPKAKRALQDISMAETKAAAELAFDAFIESFTPKYAKAADCLSKDRDTLQAFCDFPDEHWKHLRTTNPLKAPSPSCATARSDRRAVCPTGPRSQWSSSCSRAHQKTGDGSTETTSRQNSFSV
jgi:transposase-like protein